WGGRIGEINAANLKQAYLTIQPWLAPFTELTEDEYNRTIKQIVDKELDEYHSYTNHHIILVKKTISGHWFS
ncbi:2901_t:CDS:1, partial [Dentiscutata heterogama]